MIALTFAVFIVVGAVPFPEGSINVVVPIVLLQLFTTAVLLAKGAGEFTRMFQTPGSTPPPTGAPASTCCDGAFCSRHDPREARENRQRGGISGLGRGGHGQAAWGVTWVSSAGATPPSISGGPSSSAMASTCM